MSATDVLEEINERMDASWEHYLARSASTTKPYKYSPKEIQMFKILCKKFLDRLEEDENGKERCTSSKSI